MFLNRVFEAKRLISGLADSVLISDEAVEEYTELLNGRIGQVGHQSKIDSYKLPNVVEKYFKRSR